MVAVHCSVSNSYLYRNGKDFLMLMQTVLTNICEKFCNKMSSFSEIADFVMVLFLLMRHETLMSSEVTLSK